jgi:DNA topoisomerase-1
MSKSLVIVESPAKAKTIKGFLGPDFEVMASMGHVRDLPVRTLGVDLDDDFKPTYEVIRGKGKVVKQLRAAAKKATGIYLAADQDREGEAISWHVKSLLPHSDTPCYRVLFNEITRSAIRRAVDNPGQLDLAKIDAQQARRVLDRIVGYKVSPFLWRTLKTNLSAGRVQSVALRLVCEREQEILAFVPQEYWVIKVTMENADQALIEAVLTKDKGKKVRIENAADATEAAEYLKKQEFIVRNTTTVRKRTKRPAPFITSSLQQEASARLGLSPDRTMRLAQELYEGIDIGAEGHVGLITYMRTDSYRISKEAQTEARSFIAGTWGDGYVPAKLPFYGSAKRAQDAHEAIRPTSVFRRPEELSGMLKRPQFRLYDLIWRRFVASQMEQEAVEVTTVIVGAGRYTLRANGLRQQFPGHAKVWPSKRSEEELPPVSEGEHLAYKDLSKQQQFTKPKPRFTEASLVKELEAKGIGRPSTYASIISTLKRRKYVTITEKHLVPSELGKAVNEILVIRFPELFAVDFTANLEEKLDRIEGGELSWVAVLSDFYASFKKQLIEAEQAQSDVRKAVQRESGESCPVCGKPLLIKFGRHGEFLACSGYPSCRFTKPFLPSNENGKVFEDKRCPACGSPMTLKSGRFGEFLACSTYPTCKTTMPLTLDIPCPREGCDGSVVIRRSRSGKRFYGCSNYPSCDFVAWSEPVGAVCPACGAGAALPRKRGKKDKLQCLRCKHIYEPVDSSKIESQ